MKPYYCMRKRSTTWRAETGCWKMQVPKQLQVGMPLTSSGRYITDLTSNSRPDSISSVRFSHGMILLRVFCNHRVPADLWTQTKLPTQISLTKLTPRTISQSTSHPFKNPLKMYTSHWSVQRSMLIYIRDMIWPSSSNTQSSWIHWSSNWLYWLKSLMALTTISIR